MNTGRAVVGTGFVSVGVLLLLDRGDVLDAGSVIADWWPVLLLVAAGLELLARPPRRIAATVLAVLGLALLGATTDVVASSTLALVWPLGAIALGAWLLLRRPGTSAGAAAEDAIDATAVFSGRKIVSTSQDFRGGAATAVFGGIELDLVGARIEEAADLEVVALFGGVDVTVPPGWRVQLDGPAIFGGHENNVPAPPDPDAPTLRIRATAIFGAAEVKLGAAWPTTTRV